MNRKRSFWEGVSDAFSFSVMLLIAFMLFTLLLAGCSAQRPLPDIPVRTRSDVVVELNRYRGGLGLPMVTTDKMLTALAWVRSRNAWPYRFGPLAAGHSHFEQDVDASGSPGRWFGENLYSDNGQPAASEIIWGWDGSPGHRAMMRRRSTTECSAAEAFDGKRAVIALVCMDRFNAEQVKW